MRKLSPHELQTSRSTSRDRGHDQIVAQLRAARPSGTEDVYKLYAESFRGPAQLAAIQDEARAIVASVIG